MKITGTAVLHATRERVWAALNDPAVLVETIPGCQRLEDLGDDRYAMTVSAGVGTVRGTYKGEVRLSDPEEPRQFMLRASGAGTPGTVSADILVQLEETDTDTTTVRYDADAVIGGVIAGVGQRLIVGVAKKTAGEFFGAVDAELAGTRRAPVATAGQGPDAPTTAGIERSAEAGRVFESVSARSAGSVPAFRAGVLLGAAAALAGALVGAVLSRRGRR